ncbi:MAG: endonuclease/exonuclease/phosphatase family protein [Candidatus Obscuribacterales bacterium]|nr:endonuclease/exonuclease/phosphatase family protein [Candidatus Obscuribacterales bacterium]
MSNTAPVATLSLVSWNIQTGSEAPFIGNGWSRRKAALAHALITEAPDIICVQEAMIGQLKVLDYHLPGHQRVGVGRDDGAEKGEHCAIFYRRDRLVVQDAGTFWLSGTPERPSLSGDVIFRRICTWALFLDQETGQACSIFNTHFPLNPFAQTAAAELVLKKMAAICHGSKTILAGDFNAVPSSPSWKLLQRSGLRNAEDLATGKQSSTSTYHVRGRPLCCIDAVFVSTGMTVRKHRILNASYHGVWPSDHFGTYIEFEIPEFLENDCFR